MRTLLVVLFLVLGTSGAHAQKSLSYELCEAVEEIVGGKLYCWGAAKHDPPEYWACRLRAAVKYADTSRPKHHRCRKSGG